jgi:benzodiazapine receptor
MLSAFGNDVGHVRPRSHWLAWAIISIATFAVAGLGGLVSSGASDPWYQALDKAPGNPPGFVFGIVWPILYTLMAVSAGWVWSTAGGWGPAKRPMALFFAQLVPNLAWSWLFFGLHQPAAALATIAVLWALVFMMVREFWKANTFAGMLQVPYLLWLSFAAYLNAWIVFNN